MTSAKQLKDRWMQGRTLMLTRHHGMSFIAACVQAQADWDEQEAMGAEWSRQHSEAA